MDDRLILRECPFCGGDATLTSNWNRTYRKFYINCRCTVCGSSGKGYTSTVDPAEDDWQNAACYDAAAIWNKRPYLSDDIRMLAAEIVAETLRKSHTDDVSLPDKCEKKGDGNG